MRPFSSAAPVLLALALALALAFACTACESVRPPTTPMATRELEASAGGSGRCLVVLLPGRRDNFGDYGRRGFPEMAVHAGVVANFVESDAHYGYYQARTIAKRLYEDVVAPARARGVERIWVVGISMGGLGAILYAREHPEVGGGVIALAPFLGDEEPKLVAAAGGLRSYTMGPSRAGDDYERDLWGWLKSYAEQGAHRPPMWIGLGTEDKLAPSDRLLADALPAGRTFVETGGHDWKTWTRLWRDFLDAKILQRDCGR